MGIVERSDYERVRQQLQEGLQGLTFQGEKRIAKRVYLKEELYHGPFIDQAPDLVVLSHHGYDLKGKVKAQGVFGRSNLMGMHSQDDAFFYSSTGAACTSIFDAKKLILEPFVK
jgi:predicted AlkP superfamily phosphohydrolase/phosphomutase